MHVDAEGWRCVLVFQPVVRQTVRGGAIIATRILSAYTSLIQNVDGSASYHLAMLGSSNISSASRYFNVLSRREAARFALGNCGAFKAVMGA